MQTETRLADTTRSTAAPPSDGVAVRHAEVEDAPEIWRIVRDSKVLDLNSAYSYMLLCRQFRDTCLVGEVDGEVAGFVTAYKPPREPRTVFVWQIGVDGSARGRGLASRLLDRLVDLPACHDVDWLATTVTPGNEPSQALFRSFARRRDADCRVTPYFESELFPGDGHETEELYRIGPLASESSTRN